MSSDDEKNSDEEKEIFSPTVEQMFDFQQPPPELLNLIVEKFTYTMFARLDQCSVFSHQVCSEGAFHPPLSGDFIYVDSDAMFLCTQTGCHEGDVYPWVAIEKSCAKIFAYSLQFMCPLKSKRVREVIDLLLKNHTTIQTLDVQTPFKFAKKDLEELISTFSLKGLISEHQFVPKKFFSYPCFQKLKSLEIGKCEIGDEELLNLQAADMYITTNSITDAALNKFLCQWLNGERDIRNIDIKFSAKETRNFKISLENLVVNPIWTPKCHEDSLAAAIPIEDVQSHRRQDYRHLYSIFRPHFGDHIVIDLAASSFKATYKKYETRSLYYMVPGNHREKLTDPDRRPATKRMKRCDE